MHSSLFGKYLEGFQGGYPILSAHAVRDRRGMPDRREHIPSPVKQNILWSSSLKGMERPVRSFKSFIRTAPPTPEPGGDKPLPPIPSTLDISSNLAIELPPESATFEPTLSEASWKAPTEWEWENASPLVPTFGTTSLFVPRTYSPLIPDPSPDLYSMEGEPSPVFSERMTMQQTLLQTIEEGFDHRPELPLRNPSRLSQFRVSSDNITSMNTDISESTRSSPRPLMSDPVRLQLQPVVDHTVDTTYSTSDTLFTAKALVALGTELPEVGEDWTINAESPQIDANFQLFRNTRPYPLNRRYAISDEDLQGSDLKDQMQRLSFSQDYHDVLSGQYQKTRTHDMEKQVGTYQETSPERIGFAQSQALVDGIGLLPRPLTWSKEPNDSSMESSPQNLLDHAAPAAKPNVMHRRNNTSASLQQLMQEDRHSADDQARARSASDSKVPRLYQIPPGDVNVGLQQKTSGPSLLTYTKGLRSQRKRMKVSNTATSTANSLYKPSPPLAHPSLTHNTPLLRLPGGFALVRTPPSTKPDIEGQGNKDIIPHTTVHQEESSVDASIHPSGIWDHPSTWHNQHSQAPVAPAMAINKKTHDSLSSPPASRPQSNTSTPPTSPLAHEVLRSNTPPLSMHDDTKHGIFDKARNLRDEWKRRRREVKLYELKQSIKVIGLADPAVVAARIKRRSRTRRSGPIRA
jgi:hypothetical protein